MISVSVLTILCALSGILADKQQIRFSVCDGPDGYGEKCVNLGTIAHCDSVQRRSASVNGMWVFTEPEVFNTDKPAIGEFVYQEKVGVPYYTFKEENILKNGGCWRRIGYIEDYKTNAIVFHRVTGLLSDSTSIIKTTTGNNSLCLDKMFGNVKSFAILGNSSWTLKTKNGDSFCLNLKNNTSFIPGLVADIEKDIGIQQGELCTAEIGCNSDSGSKTVTIDNTVTSGVLRRT